MSTAHKRIVIGLALAGITLNILFVVLHSQFAFALARQVSNKIRIDPEYNPPIESWEGDLNDALIMSQEQFPEAMVAIAFPKFTVYENFVQKTQHALSKLGIAVLIVDEFGIVSTIRHGVET